MDRKTADTRYEHGKNVNLDEDDQTSFTTCCIASLVQIITPFCFSSSSLALTRVFHSSICLLRNLLAAQLTLHLKLINWTFADRNQLNGAVWLQQQVATIDNDINSQATNVDSANVRSKGEQSLDFDRIHIYCARDEWLKFRNFWLMCCFLFSDSFHFNSNNHDVYCFLCYSTAVLRWRISKNPWASRWHLEGGKELR